MGAHHRYSITYPPTTYYTHLPLLLSVLVVVWYLYDLLILTYLLPTYAAALLLA